MIPQAMLPTRATIEELEGTSGTGEKLWGAPRTVPARRDPRRRAVRTSDGIDVIAEATLVIRPLDVRPEARVTVDGIVYEVAGSIEHFELRRRWSTELILVGPKPAEDAPGPGPEPEPEPEPEPDSFVALDVAYDGPTQTWGQAHKLGLAFKATADLLVIGARWWRLADSTVDPPVIHLSAEMAGWSPAVASAECAAAWPADGWEEVTFDEPVPMAADTHRIIWATSEEGRTIARDDAFGPATSIAGLMETVEPSGWYNLPYIGTPLEAPMSTADPGVGYWIFPVAVPA